MQRGFTEEGVCLGLSSSTEEETRLKCMGASFSCPPTRKFWLVTIPRAMAAMIGSFLPDMLAIFAAVQNAKSYCHANSDSCTTFSTYTNNAEEEISNSAWGVPSGMGLLIPFFILMGLFCINCCNIARKKDVHGSYEFYCIDEDSLVTFRRNNCLARFFQRTVPRKEDYIKLGITFTALMSFSLMLIFATVGFTSPCPGNAPYDSDDSCGVGGKLPESMQKLMHETRSLIYGVGISAAILINAALAIGLMRLNTGYLHKYLDLGEQSEYSAFALTAPWKWCDRKTEVDEEASLVVNS